MIVSTIPTMQRDSCSWLCYSEVGSRWARQSLRGVTHSRVTTCPYMAAPPLVVAARVWSQSPHHTPPPLSSVAMICWSASSPLESCPFTSVMSTKICVFYRPYSLMTPLFILVFQSSFVLTLAHALILLPLASILLPNYVSLSLLCH